LASELCQTVGDDFFFTLHSFLEVGKTQDLPSKFWQTLEDALTPYYCCNFYRMASQRNQL
jgi:hypothetical protein